MGMGTRLNLFAEKCSAIWLKLVFVTKGQMCIIWETAFMKYKLRLLTVFIVFGFAGVSQNTLAMIDEVVAQIRSGLDNCRKVEKLNSELGYRYFYYCNNAPVAIEVQENGRIEKHVSWFFYKNKLIYTETVWTDTIDGKKIHGEKTYHFEEAMIAWLDNENTFVEASTPEFIALDKNLRTYGKKIYFEALED